MSLQSFQVQSERRVFRGGAGYQKGNGSLFHSLFLGVFFVAMFWTSGLSLWASDLLCLLAHCLVSKKVSVEHCGYHVRIM